MKLIVAGSRGITDYKVVKKHLDSLRKEINFTHIVSGCARGPDQLGERYAVENNLPCVQFPANWGLHGKSAGYIRNAEMIAYADGLLAFWDGISKGTLHAIKSASRKEMFLRAITLEAPTPLPESNTNDYSS